MENEPVYGTQRGDPRWLNHRNRGHQPYVAELISIFVPHGIGVEIGVNEGQLSCYILNHTDVKHLYLVDPWITWKGWASQETLEKLYEFCANTMPNLYPGRVSTIRKNSDKSADDVPDNLDFVFIDGNHDYDYVKNDLEIWSPKVRSGGIVLGHDWSHKYHGVIRAVMEYFENNEEFVPFATDYNQYNLKLPYQPAPAVAPVVNKSSNKYVWWMIKK